MRGCWLLPPEWLLSSLDRGGFLPEEPHMLRHAFPGARLRRPPPASNQNGDGAGAGTEDDDGGEDGGDDDDDGGDDGGDDDDDDGHDFADTSRPASRSASRPAPPLRGIAAFVDERDAAQRKIYAELLRAAGARLAPTRRGAAVCVSTAPPPPLARPCAPSAPAPARSASRAAAVVRPEWLFDSVMAGEALGFDEYRHAPA